MQCRYVGACPCNLCSLPAISFFPKSPWLIQAVPLIPGTQVSGSILAGLSYCTRLQHCPNRDASLLISAMYDTSSGQAACQFCSTREEQQIKNKKQPSEEQSSRRECRVVQSKAEQSSASCGSTCVWAGTAPTVSTWVSLDKVKA